MTQDAGQTIRYECTACDWSRTSTDFRPEWATGTCPECDAPLRWGFAPPEAAPVADSPDSDPPSEPHPEVVDLEQAQRVRRPSKRRKKKRAVSATTGKHGWRLLGLLAALGLMVFAQMTIMSDPDKAWDFLVEFFSQENPVEAQWLKLKRLVGLESAPAAKQETETPAEPKEPPKPAAAQETSGGTPDSSAEPGTP